MDAFLSWIEVDEAVDLSGNERLLSAVLHPDRLLDAGDPRARKTDPNLGCGGLEIGCGR